MSDAAPDELVALPLLCAPRTRPLHHVRALIKEPRVITDGIEFVPPDYLEDLDPAGSPVPDLVAVPEPWRDHVERGIERFRDGTRRLPHRPPDRRGPQLLRMGGAAWIAGLALLMAGHEAEAEEWLDRAASCYRVSLADAEPGNWGRCIAATKARLIAGDRRGARREARWTLELGAAEAASPIARYAAALACLALRNDDRARELAASFESEDAFPDGTAHTAAAIRALADRDRAAYAEAIHAVVRSFEERSRFLERVPVADTVIVLQRLAAERGIEEPLSSSRLPPAPREALG
jgi:hypothetical protein